MIKLGCAWWVGEGGWMNDYYLTVRWVRGSVGWWPSEPITVPADALLPWVDTVGARVQIVLARVDSSISILYSVEMTILPRFLFQFPFLRNGGYQLMYNMTLSHEEPIKNWKNLQDSQRKFEVLFFERFSTSFERGWDSSQQRLVVISNNLIRINHSHRLGF